MPKLTLRTATIADLELLLYWRAAACNRCWSGWRLELGGGAATLSSLAGATDCWNGCLQIIDPVEEETHYWGEVPANLRTIDIWIREVDYLNQGFGTQMMGLAIDRCFADPEVTAILIDHLASNTGAIRFYERLGFGFVEKRSFGGSDCMVYRLQRDWPRFTPSPIRSGWILRSYRSLHRAILCLKYCVW